MNCHHPSPHPYPLPSDGREDSNRLILLLRITVRQIQSQFFARDGLTFSLSHRMGEGRGEGQTLGVGCWMLDVGRSPIAFR